jgi:hypothetical protein
MNIRKLKARTWLIASSAVMLASAIVTATVPNLFPFQDPTGHIATFNVSGSIDTTNPFFQSLGTNGRTCASCHVAGNAFGLAPADVQARFLSSNGTDPLFASVDGANCPSAAPDNAADHSLLLNNGLIRIFLPVPTNAEFTLTVVHDPYGCALVADPTGQQNVSVYRRPLPTTNLHFLSAVMFDGRESPATPNSATGQGPLNNPSTFMQYLRADLAHQALDATLRHAQASTAPGPDALGAIVDLELGFFTAQTQDNAAGPLDAQGAAGGPRDLSSQPYYPGINDSFTPAVFNPEGFTAFKAWENLSSSLADVYTSARERVAAGERIFNTRTFNITNVRGINDNAAIGKPAAIVGTCTTCHDTPNVGNHSLPVPLDIGTSHATTNDLAYEPDSNIAAALAQISSPDMPVFLITGCASPFTGQAVSFYTSDPGKALISGKCADFNRGKGPILRGLAARAPYFHNGAAASLNEIVNFYNARFNMGLSDEEKMALVAFLRSL